MGAVGGSASLLLAIEVLRRQGKDKRSEQAAKVHGSIRKMGARAGTDDALIYVWQCLAYNASDIPVYDFVIHVVQPDGTEAEAVSMGQVDPSGQPSQTTAEVQARDGEWTSWIEFTDAAGVKWARGRYRDHALREVR